MNTIDEILHARNIRAKRISDKISIIMSCLSQFLEANPKSRDRRLKDAIDESLKERPASAEDIEIIYTPLEMIYFDQSNEEQADNKPTNK